MNKKFLYNLIGICILVVPSIYGRRPSIQTSIQNPVSPIKETLVNQGSRTNDQTAGEEFDETAFDVLDQEFIAPAQSELGDTLEESIQSISQDTILSASNAPSAKPESPLTKEAQSNPDLYGPADEKKDIYLNFEGAELKNFIEYIADIKKMNIIPDKSIAGNKISLNFRNPVTKTGAWNAFLTILEMANFSIIKVGNLYRIVSKDKKFRQPLPTFIGVKAETLPDSDATIRYIAFLNNLPAQEVKPVLQSMLSTANNLIDPPNINGFIITDCACTIKAAMQVIEELDQTGLQESIYVMKLKRANARDVKTLFDNLTKKSDSNSLAKYLGRAEDSSDYFAPGTRMIAEDRTNALIMMGQRQALEKIKAFIVDHVDTELKQARSPLRIYELQNASATELVTILREVTNSANSSAAGQQAAKYGAIRDGVKYFKNMTFQADKESNRLLVSCTDENDWLLLKETIKKLDTAQPQVAMQMLIVAISAKSVNEFGGQMRNKTHGLLGSTMDFQTSPVGQTVFETDGSGNSKSLLGNLLQSLVVERGSSMLSIGKLVGGEGIWGILRALKTDTDATVLSEPFAVTANCTEAKILVGESTWITDQETGGTDETRLRSQTQANANTTITFTPQVNTDGIIKLKIAADIKEFVPESNGLSTQQKYLEDTVSVANGQVLAIGGFVKTKVTDSGGQTPFWGSIPILGWLAKNLSRNVEKEYVFLFLCPTILKPRATPGIGMYSKINLHAAAKEVEEAIQTTKSNDPIYNFIFNASNENYSHKVIDFANARYQPNNVDIRFDPYYRTTTADSHYDEHVLHIDQEPASPQEYVRKEAAKQKVVKKTTQIEAKPTIPQTPIHKVAHNRAQAAAVEMPHIPTPPPATEQTSPEKVVLATPQMEEDDTPITAITTQESPKAKVDDLESSIAENRSRLRALLSHATLPQLLSKSTESDTAETSLSSQSEASQHVTTETPTQEIDAITAAPLIEASEEISTEQQKPVLARRQGLKNLLAPAHNSITPPSQTPMQRRSAGLQTILGGN
jgi:general secretion pathway protein D